MHCNKRQLEMPPTCVLLRRGVWASRELCKSSVACQSQADVPGHSVRFCPGNQLVTAVVQSKVGFGASLSGAAKVRGHPRLRYCAMLGIGWFATQAYCLVPSRHWCKVEVTRPCIPFVLMSEKPLHLVYLFLLQQLLVDHYSALPQYLQLKGLKQTNSHQLWTSWSVDAYCPLPRTQKKP
mmetsp:Transcript_110983/g.353600  ORF Transcript_110983/g.353600 Transcript_110983/m.353600 type:complete len:180 (+) Transcript_110983:1171-1710(+)